MATTIAVSGTSAAAAPGWQQWGPWKDMAAITGEPYRCRTYADATDLGAEILVGGLMECTKRVSVMAVYSVADPGRVESTACRDTLRCNVSYRVPNPPGAQPFTVATTGNVFGQHALPVRVQFSA